MKSNSEESAPDRGRDIRQTTSRSLTPETAMRGEIEPQFIDSKYVEEYNDKVKSQRDDLEIEVLVTEGTIEKIKGEQIPQSSNKDLAIKYQQVRDEHLAGLNKQVKTKRNIVQNLQEVTSLPECLFDIQYQHQIGDQEDQKKPRVSHSGIDVRKLKGLGNFPIIQGALHPIEKAAIAGGLNKLRDVQDAKSLEDKPTDKSPNNLALVDIIARNQDGSIKEEVTKEGLKTGLPETHTVVVWKVSDKEYQIIDPNRDKFSEHLTKGNPSILGTEFPEVKFPQNPGDLYNAKASPQKRDCIDIAVKIAFTINEQEKQGKTIDQITEYVKERFNTDVARNPFYAPTPCQGVFSRDAAPPKEMFASDPNTRARTESMVKGLVEHVECQNQARQKAPTTTTVKKTDRSKGIS